MVSTLALEPIDLQPIVRLTRDLKAAAITLGADEARYLVDAYYNLQDYRKAAGNQQLALTKSGEPHIVLSWLHGQMETMEGQIKRALDAWSDASATGQWLKSITGIGPVLAAGLLAYDRQLFPTVGHLWSLAGLDPNRTWEKGQNRPWNASLKVLCWKMGESFWKFQNHPKDIYGKLIVQRKEYEQGRNDRGELAEQAASALARKRIGKETEAYKWYSQGKLPPAQIHARAKRWGVKLFLAHYHEVRYRNETGQEPPKPYVIEHLGHGHYMPPPQPKHPVVSKGMGEP